MKALTRAELALRVADLTRQMAPMELALSDLAFDRVNWFGRGQWHLGVSRPTGSHGGIAIVVDGGCVSAHYFEEWAPATLAHVDCLITGERNEYNARLAVMRDQITRAQSFVRRMQDADGADRANRIARTDPVASI